MRFDDTGKVTLDHIYTQPDPRAYFTALRKLEYHIPQLAKPYFAKLIEDYRQARQVDVPQVLDIGSSYGINAALLRCDLTMDELYDRYCGIDDDPRAALVARDRELVRARTGAARARFVGLDIAEPALAYATETGFLDDSVHADLERNDPTPGQQRVLAGNDLVISTGSLGYVGANTLAKVIGDRAPWMAHFVLRMFPFDDIEERLAGFGYETVRVDGVFRQRRFVSAEEQSGVLDTLSGVGVDPDLELDGWLYAQLYVSRAS